MTYKEFKAAQDANKQTKAEKAHAVAMAAPSEARQRIEAYITENKAKLAFNKNK